MEARVDTETGEIYGEPATDEWLLEVLQGAQGNAKAAAEQVDRIIQELMRRAEERGATVIRGKGMNFVITTKNEYDRTKLPPVLELFDPEGKDKAFSPAHMEEVLIPEKWNMQQVNKYAKQAGNEALAIVEASMFPGKASGKLVKVDS